MPDERQGTRPSVIAQESAINWPVTALAASLQR
jgi:hypothetical protein